MLAKMSKMLLFTVIYSPVNLQSREQSRCCFSRIVVLAVAVVHVAVKSTRQPSIVRPLSTPPRVAYPMLSYPTLQTVDPEALSVLIGKEAVLRATFGTGAHVHSSS